MEMSERIKERRLAMNYTQEELAIKLGLQKSAIAKYENGRVENIKRSTIVLMSEVLECSPCYLMGWTNKLNSNLSDINDNSVNEKLDFDTIGQLNDVNISKLNTYSKKLLELQKLEEEPVLMAAHNDNPDAEELEKIKSDMDLLKKHK